MTTVDNGKCSVSTFADMKIIFLDSCPNETGQFIDKTIVDEYETVIYHYLPFSDFFKSSTDVHLHIGMN